MVARLGRVPLGIAPRNIRMVVIYHFLMFISVEQPFLPTLLQLLLFHRLLLARLFPIEPSKPDADLVEEKHGQCHQVERHDVWSRSNDGGGDVDRDDRIGAGPRHGLVGEQAELHEHHHNHGQLEGKPEQERELGRESDVFADPPVIGDTQFGTPIEEEQQCAREDEEIRKQHT